MEVVYVGQYDNAKIAYPALFYTDLEDESPLYVETPHNAPRWSKNIVAVIDDGEEGSRVYLLGENIDEALRNVGAILYNMEKASYKYGSASWYNVETGRIYDDILPGKDDELYEIAYWDSGYSFIYGREFIGWIEMDEDPHSGTCRCHVPLEVKLSVLEKMVRELFEA